jgi:hypothetical protein
MLAPLLIGLLHWNPHWQCFAGNAACTAGATKALSSFLGQKGGVLDFANVIGAFLGGTPVRLKV